jgi:N-acetylglucosamine-6-phosphate deacetylase
VTPRADELASLAAVADGPVVVTPGFVDLQLNGVDDVDCATARDDDWDRLGTRLLAAGTTAYLATVCSMPLDRYAATLDRIAAARAECPPHRPRIEGVHLEGPFLGGAPGAHPPDVLRTLDVEWLAGLLDRHPGLVRLVTLAPEADPGADGIRMLVERGVVVSLGHSTCTYDDAVAAAEAGARLVTHLFNGMAALHHRAPGLAGAALDPRVPLTPTLIGDLVHVSAPVVATVFAACAPVLVSDAVATVAPTGPSVAARDGAAVLADGTLAGATALLDRAVANVTALGVVADDVLAAASARPAGLLGLDAGPGLVARDPAGTVVAVWLDGEQAYSRPE